MKATLVLALAALLAVPPLAGAGFLDDLPGKVLPSLKRQATLDDNIIADGLKEALALGTEHAVQEVARPNGYFADELIKILLPGKLQRIANFLGEVGYQKEVDELELGMNRAAEKAAPKAAKFFGDAIRHMTLEDAKGILHGGDTAATQFFERKTRSQLFDAFKPTVVENMERVGVARLYDKVIGKYQSLPLASLAGVPSLDLNSYVTDKALDGLFIKVGNEEKKIRSNPAARTTDLLRKVFGRQ